MSHEAEGSSALNSEADAGRDSSGRGNQIRHILSVVLALNILVAGAKLGYGFFSGSVAMFADGFHSLLDGFANVVGIIGIVVAARPPDREHHFGHERYETLASMAIGAVMAVGVLEIVQSAIGRWQSGEAPQVTSLSFGVMLGTMAINIGVTVWERRAARRLHSDLLEADARHTGSDVLASAAVILGLIGERIGLRGADAAVSLVVAGMVALAAWEILREASLVLTDAATDVEPRALLAAIVTVPGAITAHNLRVRSSGGRSWVEVHVTVDPQLTVKQAHEVATEVESAIRNEVGPETQAIVHVEPAEPPHTRPDPIFGQEFEQTTDQATGARRTQRLRKGIR
ncbi:MAG TPA: cation diffusion facilitator family transporter [Thermomicrobiales bacterium]|nr:cation diffusion facilitator family transporter [Thermomicrobiales bacterium]